MYKFGEVFDGWAGERTNLSAGPHHVRERTNAPTSGTIVCGPELALDLRARFHPGPSLDARRTSGRKRSQPGA